VSDDKGLLVIADCLPWVSQVSPGVA
jgi:hypothetical protein